MKRSHYWELKRKSIRHYDEIAGGYDDQYADEQIQKYTIALTAVNACSCDYMLDLGCGTGLFIKTVTGLGGYMIAVDSSKKMIQEANLKHGKKAFFLCADADYLPFRDQIFNDVFVFTLFQNMPDPKITIKEIRRVTKTEAKVVVTLLKRAQSNAMAQNLLNTAGLNVIQFIDKNELKDYVAICELFR
ncbi:MAG: class I SAM-dependent methyltransferase [Candidatus Bathyarchaeota archaeon]|nr:MAG: class I SAM-dependent methyltransferase [Candidatus Bathyarchaeota archaeon]